MKEKERMISEKCKEIMRQNGIKDGDGYISVKDMKEVLRGFGIEVAEVTIYKWLKNGDIPPRFVEERKKLKRTWYMIHIDALLIILEKAGVEVDCLKKR